MSINTNEQKLSLTVIVGSVRENRLGEAVTRWAAERAEEHGDFEVVVLDPAEHDLPLSLTGADDVKEHVAGVLDASAAFLFVTPEYNHSFPAALKNLIDWYGPEWYGKPAGIVSYGGISGGLRATEHLRAVLAELHVVTVRDTVSFHNAWGHWGQDGVWPKDSEQPDTALKKLLGQLSWWSRALVAAKAVEPYPG
ncbi:NAD(P)H-dependent oxidoreductase [Actinocorallia sp. API 0066]|uniref:NADPH-dependent FMN reductase n=1 Tax=Actinocorallia sp. API 0066 TaxID=2896846 RepID=UPI001E47ECCC|nr:NAD(P)H-dependent oxidoreductase [Actinocorallia sp. API 0066]MCD0452398.1 NAD(P)H-dependent oxidoreductase [Actinocorallia sp. API 0066]